MTPEHREAPPDPGDLPPDDYLAAARAADLALARKVTRECRRPQRPWNHDVVGPTENWRLHALEGVVPKLGAVGEVAA